MFHWRKIFQATTVLPRKFLMHYYNKISKTLKSFRTLQKWQIYLILSTTTLPHYPIKENFHGQLLLYSKNYAILKILKREYPFHHHYNVNDWFMKVKFTRKGERCYFKICVIRHILLFKKKKKTVLWEKFNSTPSVEEDFNGHKSMEWRILFGSHAEIRSSRLTFEKRGFLFHYLAFLQWRKIKILYYFRDLYPIKFLSWFQMWSRFYNATITRQLRTPYIQALI